MRTRSLSGGRHELGQNFLTHRPTLQRLTDLVAATQGPILEIGAGDGALTERLAALGRDLRAIEIDERRIARLRARVPSATVRQADALRESASGPVGGLVARRSATATKTDTPLSETPMSVTVVPREQIVAPGR